MNSVQARTLPRSPAAALVDSSARLELLEYYLVHHEDLVRCAQASLEWIARHAGIKRSACLAVDVESSMLVGLAAYGVNDDVELFTWPIGEAHDPLVAALGALEPTTIRSNGDYRGRLAASPLGTGSLIAIPLRGSAPDAGGV